MHITLSPEVTDSALKSEASAWMLIALAFQLVDMIHIFNSGAYIQFKGDGEGC